MSDSLTDLTMGWPVAEPHGRDLTNNYVCYGGLNSILDS